MVRHLTELVAFARLVDAPAGRSLPEGCEEVILNGTDIAIVAQRPPAPRLTQSKRTRRRVFGEAALLRQRRLEALMTGCALLPFAPGTDVPPDLSRVLKANTSLVEQSHTAIQGKQQFQVIVSWDQATAPARFGVSSAALPDVKSRLQASVYDKLLACSTDAIALPCRPDDVANVVVLMHADGVVQLERALEEIDAIWTSGLRLRLLGPAPAVSFFRLSTSPIDREACLAAAAFLQLAQDAVPDPSHISSARKDALRRFGNQPGFDPDTINKAAKVMSLCSALSCAPSAAECLHLLTSERDGPSLAPSGHISLDEVA